MEHHYERDRHVQAFDIWTIAFDAMSIEGCCATFGAEYEKWEV